MWIKENFSDTAVINAFYDRLPLLVEKHGGDTIAEYLHKIIQVIPRDELIRLHKHAERLDINIELSERSEIFTSLTKKDLKDLAKKLSLITPDDSQAKRSWIQIIEQQLFDIAKRHSSSPYPPYDIMMIIGIWKILREKHVILSFNVREKILIKIKDLFHYPIKNADNFLLETIPYVLSTEGRNPEREIAKEARLSV